jgi:ubiquinone/menaquinone biosynthesis C-methylase UbiE
MMKEVDYRGWAKYLVLLMQVGGKESRRSQIRDEKLCELACGTGNISIILSKLGYDVTGVDSSIDMLNVAREKLTKKNSERLHLVHQDMVMFSAEEMFDRAVCVYDSLNYIPSKEALGQFFVNVYRSLKAGGIFVFDASLESNSLNDSSLFVQHGKSKGVYYHRKSQYDRATKIHTTFVRIKKKDRIFEEVHREYVYPIGLIRRLFSEAGFEERFAAGDFTMLEANDESERVHFVVTKPNHD